MTLKAGFRIPHFAFRLPHSAFCLLLLILGCGNAIEDALPTGRALSRLQERCPWMDEQQIADVIAVVRIFKNERASLGAALVMFTETCQEDNIARDPPLGTRDCISCVLAITEDVYD